MLKVVKKSFEIKSRKMEAVEILVVATTEELPIIIVKLNLMLREATCPKIFGFIKSVKNNLQKENQIIQKTSTQSV